MTYLRIKLPVRTLELRGWSATLTAMFAPWVIFGVVWLTVKAF